MADQSKRIVVFRIGHLGDSLLSLPAIQAIQERFPLSQLILLTNRSPRPGVVSCWDVLGPTGIFEKVLFYEPHLPVYKRCLSLLRLIVHLRRLRPEALFYLAPFPRSRNKVTRDRFCFRTLCGIQHLFGLEATDPLFGSRTPEGTLIRLPQEADRLLSIVAQSGIGAAHQRQIQFRLPIQEVHRRSASLLWKAAGWSEGMRVLAIAPGSKMQAKQWPEENFLELGRRLLVTYPTLGIAAFGGPEETDLSERLCRIWGRRSFSFSGKMSIWETTEALRRCILYVGNDTGIMHLAASAGIRCVGIFSARDHPGLWEPYGDGHIALRAEVPCSGCLLEYCGKMDRLCLKKISVDAVERALAKILS